MVSPCPGYGWCQIGARMYVHKAVDDLACTSIPVSPNSGCGIFECN